MEQLLLNLAHDFHQAQRLSQDVHHRNEKVLRSLLCKLRMSKGPRFYLLNDGRTDHVGVNDACLQEFITVVHWNEEGGNSDYFTVVVGDPNSTLGLWNWLKKLKFV